MGPKETPSLEAPLVMVLFSPFETPSLEPLCASGKLEHVASLKVPLEAPSSEPTEAPLEMEPFAPFETPSSVLTRIEAGCDHSKQM
jgi:hypothetical protein